MLRRAKRILLLLEDMEAELSEYTNGMRGQVRLWANTSSITQFVPEDLTRYVERFPEVGIELREETTSLLAPYFERETAPGDDVQTDDELLDFARQTGTTVYHLIGSARMGPASDPDAVVDAQLRVHGLEGLRVVDASIMPTMPSANTNAATMMIAEKGADMILGRVTVSA